jgi:hypothetical protein
LPVNEKSVSDRSNIGVNFYFFEECKYSEWFRLLRDLRLPPRFKSLLPSSGLLRGVRWFDTDVSGLPVGPVFKAFFFDILTFEDGTDQYSRKVGFRPPYAAQ